MIRERLIALREARALLMARAGRQREEMYAGVERAEFATAWFDRVRSILLGMREHPLWVAAGVALLVALRPRKALRLLATGYSVWKGWRGLIATLERIAPRQPAARSAH